ncbi:hypothetical protein BCE02nite_32510 [Brevibacillus centrosporus]|nr:hypothetical protein BCE02nite_32510 [Brevibacillus centrosporus]
MYADGVKPSESNLRIFYACYGDNLQRNLYGGCWLPYERQVSEGSVRVIGARESLSTSISVGIGHLLDGDIRYGAGE